MALTKKQFAKKTYSVSDTNLADDPTKASAPQKLVLEAAYGVYVAELSKYEKLNKEEKLELINKLSQLKVELEAQRGETNVEKTKLQAFGYFARRGVTGFIEGAAKPFSEWSVLDSKEKEQSIEPKPTELDSVSTASGNTTLSIEKELPSGWRFPIAVISRFFARLSPLNTAILFGLVFAASATYGSFTTIWAEKRVESIKVDLKVARGELNTAENRLAKLEGIENDNKRLERQIGNLQRDIETLAGEKSNLKESLKKADEEHRLAMQDKLQEYNDSIASYRSDANTAAAEEATKQANKILALSEEVGRLRGEKQYFEDYAKDLEQNYKTTTANETAAQNDAKIANELYRQANGELTTLRAENRQLRELVTHTSEAIYAIEKYFGKNNLSSVRIRRACYRIAYVSISDRFNELAAQFDVPVDLKFDNYDSINDYSRRWTNECL
ncbi:hypothetical protein N480_00675 [Pseudoalteromonas luteoviolacea S2607]|uniref:hypothetical protein n=1 Tax=Pseudoalteromonas luteoviolacea TaxID=43657 RepID=UPI0007B07787|nr:hypothetical protein [Pseudoalteromonas luteoviolacea]KZN39376.1 hypothetical protein N480_00675 [Pseudoalteromonas luteoviolacea S2607]